MYELLRTWKQRVLEVSKYGKDPRSRHERPEAESITRNKLTELRERLGRGDAALLKAFRGVEVGEAYMDERLTALARGLPTRRKPFARLVSGEIRANGRAGGPDAPQGRMAVRAAVVKTILRC